ncbi:MAG: RdgB/HAM1 family non-canonical purine NTP pyrophosphatase [Planctomycetes bacterium]|nr:RdgB/HAM1 family non-canonical purine NTP pyrophosphatase [Planctomycetota bacterium]
MDTLVLASHNTKKLLELGDLLRPLGISLRSLAQFPAAPPPVEDGATFADNARIKALDALRRTGLPAVADDSGLVVPALGGEPGVRSARYAGEEADDAANNRLLLERLRTVPEGERGARFVSVIALALPGGEVQVFSGETTGTILHRPRGQGGFGYDPLFLSDDLGVTFAEAAPEAKNRVSHRARALARAVAWLSGKLPSEGAGPGHR